PCESHHSVQDLITARGLVDLVIPRGCAGLINAVVTGATVPTIEPGTGNCHCYVDASADIDTAIAMAVTGKTHRCSVCHCTETVMLVSALCDEAKLRVIKAFQDAGVNVHGHVDELTALGAQDVHEGDQWNEEHLSFDIRIAVVEGV